MVVDREPSTHSDWEVRAAAKRAIEHAKIPLQWRVPEQYLVDINEHSEQSVIAIPAKCGILAPFEIDITERYNAVSLAQAVQSGALKAVHVATAFCKRAAIAQQLCNCLTETFFDDAIERGKWLDRYLAEHKKPVGPLHGVPVSIKDCFNYVGVASTLGYVAYLDDPLPTQNSSMVDVLLGLGAILYCKTNVSQFLGSADSDNNLFGRVLNPHKLTLGAGGSSGGEGALVAMRGSVLGVGTDIGGSIRIPALCDGTYGFKPSSYRMPDSGQMWEGRRGTPGFPSVSGPLANSLADLELFLASVIESKPWVEDVLAMAVPWRSLQAKHSLQVKNVRIGYLVEDDGVRVHPPVRRAIQSSIAKLKAAGFTLTELTSHPALAMGEELAEQYFNLEPEPKVSTQIIKKSGEPVIKSLRRPPIVKPKGNSMDDLYNLNVARSDYKAAWHKLWLDHDIDVILCPAAQTTAVLHDTYGSLAYTATFNLLEYPAVIIPVGKADESIDTEDLVTPDPARPYRAADVDGAPLTIQLVGKPYFDEELVAAARLIDGYVTQ